MTMPRMSGIEALRRLRASGARTPVLLSSGYNIDHAGDDVSEFNGVLEKPYGVEELWAAVERTIRDAAAPATAAPVSDA